MENVDAASRETEDAKGTTRGRGWGVVLGLLGLAVVLPGLGVLGLAEPLGEVAEGLRQRAGWTLPVFIVAAAVLTGLAVLPTHAVSLAAGFVYGIGGGLLGAMGGVLGGSLVGYAVTGRLSSDRLRAWVDGRPRGRALAAALIDARGWRAVMAVALLRLPPQVPFALANVLGAMLAVRVWPFVLGTGLGMLPRVALVVWVGGELGSWDAGAAPPASLWLALGAAVVGLVGLGALSWRVLRRAGG